MKKFLKPEMNVVRFNNEDIITTSPNGAEIQGPGFVGGGCNDDGWDDEEE